MSSVAGRTFFDTNVLLYTLDATEHEKRATARRLFREKVEARAAFASTQVLGEFASKLLVKFRLTPDAAAAELRSLHAVQILVVEPALIATALEIQASSRLSYWDALILAAAAALRCDACVSEDMNHGQLIRGVRVINPFCV